MVAFYVLSILVLVHHDAVYGETPSTTVTSDTTTTSVTADATTKSDIAVTTTTYYIAGTTTTYDIAGTTTKSVVAGTTTKSVIAGTTDTEYSLRLTYKKYGMVEIKIRNSRGFICPNHFNDADAMVVCRELGYKGGFAYLLVRKYDNGFIPLVFSLGCTGTETRIHDCSNFMLGNVSDCHPDSFAAAHCYNNSGYEFRLVNESSPGYGLVEMGIDGEWRPFCGYQGFNSRAIDYICQKIGYSAGSFVSRSQRNQVERIWVTHIHYCDEYSATLLRCPIVLYPDEEPYDARSSANNRYRGLIAYRCYTGLLPTIKCF